MSLNANSLTTVETLKSHLGIPSGEASVDSRLELLINAASQAIERYLDRSLKSQAYTELHHGRRQDSVLLRQWPVTAVTQVRFDNSHAFTDAATIVPSDEYGIGDDQNSIIFYDRIVPRGNNNVQVTYTAGYATVPSDIEYAALLYCEWLYYFRNRQDIGRSSKSKGDESMAISQGIPEIVLQMIQPYKRNEFALIEGPVGNQ